MGVFLGDEVDHNRLVTYLERDGGISHGHVRHHDLKG